MRFPVLGTTLVSLALTLAGSVGCAAEADRSASDETSEDNFTSRASASKLLGDVVSIDVDGKTVAAEGKVRGILSAMRLGADDATPDLASAVPRCILSHEVSFYGSQRKLLASGGFMCGESRTTGAATAFIHVDDDIYSVEADLGGVFAELEKPVQTADVLYDVTSISITRPSQSIDERGTGAGAAILADVLSAVGPTITPVDPSAPVPRCLPARDISFYRGEDKAASITVTCDANFGIIGATLSGPDDEAMGTVLLDMRKVVRVEDSLRWTR